MRIVDNLLEKAKKQYQDNKGIIIVGTLALELYSFGFMCGRMSRRRPKAMVMRIQPSFEGRSEDYVTGFADALNVVNDGLERHGLMITKEYK